MNKKSKKTAVCLVGIAFLTAVIVFFSYYHVSTVEVRGTTHYTDEEIKDMVLRGPLASNSVLAPIVYSTANTGDIAFVDAFKVTQLSRNTICISVKEKKPVGCIRYLDSYIYFDRNGTFVEGSQTREEAVPYFDGIQVKSVIMDEKLDIKGDTVLNTAVALSTIFQKNEMIPDHIAFDKSYAISLIYGDVTVQLGKDENLEEKMSRVLAILPHISEKKGILHMESVSSDMNTFEEEQPEITAENWPGGFDEEGDYTGVGEYDENGNYVGQKPLTPLEEAIAAWGGGYDEEGDYTGAGEYNENGEYVGPKPTQEDLDAAAENVDESFEDEENEGSQMQTDYSEIDPDMAYEGEELYENENSYEEEYGDENYEDGGQEDYDTEGWE